MALPQGLKAMALAQGVNAMARAQGDNSMALAQEVNAISLADGKFFRSDIRKLITNFYNSRKYMHCHN